MLLLALILIPLLAAVGIFLGAPARLTTIVAATANLAISISTAITPCIASPFSILVMENPTIHLSLGLDGISTILLLLATIVTLTATLSGTCPQGKEKLWFSSILLISTGAIGAFIATDLFFFYAFHELALIPTFLMIGILGRGDRKEAAWKATVYLAFGSIVLLAGVLLAATHIGSFAFSDLKAIADLETQKTVAILLIIGFGTLVSLFPFHSWAAPAYASAPAPVAMLHAGVLKKFGLYGLLRVGLAVAPEGMQHWLNLLIVLLLCNILWVGFVTINQKRLDLMLGNSSVMHMGYIFLAIAALVAAGGNISGENGYNLATCAAVLLMFAHGISIALSFALTDQIEAKTKTLELNQLGGLAKSAPGLAFLFGLAGMASIGLPGLANFAGEVMVFFSGFEGWDSSMEIGPVQIATIIAIWGVVISAVYMLRAFRNIFQGGTVRSTENVTDLSTFEKAPAIILAAVLLIVGCYPNILLNLLK